MSQSTDQPLIYTSKGNLPISDLKYRYEWKVTDSEVVFIEEYWLGDELVKRNSHCKLKQGLDSSLEQQLFG